MNGPVPTRGQSPQAMLDRAWEARRSRNARRRSYRRVPAMLAAIEEARATRAALARATRPRPVAGTPKTTG